MSFSERDFNPANVNSAASNQANDLTTVPMDVLMDSVSLYLDLPACAPLRASFSTPGAEQRARLNHLCWQAVRDWVKEDLSLSRVNVWPAAKALPSVWEVVNGTALQVGDRRWVLLPTAEMEQQELRIPQEWVDIPEWVADYYLGIEVNEAEGYLRIWGYTTHEQIKRQGSYDSSDRTYVMDEAELLHNVDSLGLDPALCQSTALRTSVAPLPSLPLAQAENLIQRLGAVSEGRVSQVFPRQALPFAQWGALLAHGGWRQRIYEQRQGVTSAATASRSVLSWLQTGVDELSQGWGWQRGTLATQMRQSADCVVRSLTLGEATYALRIFPSPQQSEAWRFELRPDAADGHIPTGTTLRLLSEDLQPFDHNSDVAVSDDCTQLYVDVQLAPGEGLVWETDPMPEGVEREILRF